MNNEPLVAVVIVHWGSPEITNECIDSVCKSDYNTLKIVVVDNCPEKRLWQEPFDRDGPITYILVPTNTGYCGGNNIGIRRALELRAKYVLLLNNDAIIDKKMIKKCVISMEERPAVVVISPKLYFYHKPHHIYMVGAELNIASEMKFIGWNQKDIGQYDQEREINFAHGSALFARTSVFERVGLFDERLFCYGEDGELSRRIGMAGMKMIYYPKAKAWHRCASMEFESKGVLSNKLATYYMWRNRLFSIRHFLIERRVRCFCEFLFGFVKRFASFALKYRRFDLCRAMLLGLIDALIGRMGKREYAFFKVPVTRR